MNNQLIEENQYINEAKNIFYEKSPDVVFKYCEMILENTSLLSKKTNKFLISFSKLILEFMDENKFSSSQKEIIIKVLKLIKEQLGS